MSYRWGQNAKSTRGFVDTRWSSSEVERERSYMPRCRREHPRQRDAENEWETREEVNDRGHEHREVGIQQTHHDQS